MADTPTPTATPTATPPPSTPAVPSAPVAKTPTPSKVVITKVDPLGAKGPKKNEQFGESVTITGSGFGEKQGTSVLLLRNKAVKPTSWSDTLITANVTRDGGPATVVLAVRGQVIEASLE